MALGPRLDLTQSQSLVMTPQLQQAIKLLALSNLELEAFIAERLDENPLLEIGGEPAVPTAEIATTQPEPRRTPLESSPVDQLIGEGRGEEDRPLDVESALAESEPDTGDGQFASDWGAQPRNASDEHIPSIEEHKEAEKTLVAHLESQLGAEAFSEREAAIARYIIGQLDEAGYLWTPLRDIADELGVALCEVEDALILVQSLDPTGVGATSLAECITLQAREANRYDPAMARMIDNLDLVAKGDFARLRRICGVDEEDLADM
ncbi:MAG: RNA polymerase sigma-54 factor, partial [Novosphingobium sp.]|nr:RNA polymerase sigma-54 factor [Novosphingobium sp.]